MATFKIQSDVLRRAAEAVRVFAETGKKAGVLKYLCLDTTAAGGIRLVAGGASGAGSVNLTSAATAKSSLKTQKVLVLPADVLAVSHCENGSPCQITVKLSAPPTPAATSVLDPGPRFSGQSQTKVTFSGPRKRVEIDARSGAAFPDFSSYIKTVHDKKRGDACQIDGNVVKFTSKVIAALSVDGKPPGRVTVQTSAGAAAISVGNFQGYVQYVGAEPYTKKAPRAPAPGPKTTPAKRRRRKKEEVGHTGFDWVEKGTKRASGKTSDKKSTCYQYSRGMRWQITVSGKTGGTVFGTTKSQAKEEALRKIPCAKKGGCDARVFQLLDKGSPGRPKKTTTTPPKKKVEKKAELIFRDLTSRPAKTPAEKTAYAAGTVWLASTLAHSEFGIGTVYAKTKDGARKKAKAEGWYERGHRLLGLTRLTKPVEARKPVEPKPPKPKEEPVIPWGEPGPVDFGEPVAVMIPPGALKVPYFKGDKARWTGSSDEGFWEMEILEGHRKGEKVWQDPTRGGYQEQELPPDYGDREPVPEDLQGELPTPLPDAPEEPPADLPGPVPVELPEEEEEVVTTTMDWGAPLPPKF